MVEEEKYAGEVGEWIKYAECRCLYILGIGLRNNSLYRYGLVLGIFTMGVCNRLEILHGMAWHFISSFSSPLLSSPLPSSPLLYSSPFSPPSPSPPSSPPPSLFLKHSLIFLLPSSSPSSSSSSSSSSSFFSFLKKNSHTRYKKPSPLVSKTAFSLDIYTHTYNVHTMYTQNVHTTYTQCIHKTYIYTK